MKKQEKIRSWFVLAGWVIAFTCLQITISFPVFDFTKTSASGLTSFPGTFPSDLWNNLPDSRPCTEDNTESGTDTFSESIFKVNIIEYPFFCFIKKRNNCRFDLYYPDHLESFSPPPEDC